MSTVIDSHLVQTPVVVNAEKPKVNFPAARQELEARKCLRAAGAFGLILKAKQDNDVRGLEQGLHDLGEPFFGSLSDNAKAAVNMAADNAARGLLAVLVGLMTRVRKLFIDASQAQACGKKLVAEGRRTEAYQLLREARAIDFSRAGIVAIQRLVDSGIPVSFGARFPEYGWEDLLREARKSDRSAAQFLYLVRSVPEQECTRFEVQIPHRSKTPSDPAEKARLAAERRQRQLARAALSCKKGNGGKKSSGKKKGK